MGVIVNKNNTQDDELTRRISADLESRRDETQTKMNDPDLAEDAEYLKDLKK